MAPIHLVHFCFRRINPALSIDTLNVGIVKDGRFIPLDDQQLESLLQQLEALGLSDFIHRDSICSEAYVIHVDVAKFLARFHVDSMDWFQDTFVAVLPFTLDPHEPTKEED